MLDGSQIARAYGLPLIDYGRSPETGLLISVGSGLMMASMDIAMKLHLVHGHPGCSHSRTRPSTRRVQDGVRPYCLRGLVQFDQPTGRFSLEGKPSRGSLLLPRFRRGYDGIVG